MANKTYSEIQAEITAKIDTTGNQGTSGQDVKDCLNDVLDYAQEHQGGGGGGTSNFNDLTNRPKYNGVTMTGSTNVVPGIGDAPSDGSEYVRKNGSWAVATGGGGSSVVPVLYVGISGDPDDWSADKTYSEILAAYNSGRVIAAVYEDVVWNFFAYASSERMFVFKSPKGNNEIVINYADAVDVIDNWDFKYASNGSVYDEVHPSIGTSIGSGMQSNKLYNLGAISSATTMTLATPEDATIANHWYFTFETGATAPSITWDSAITSWQGNCLTEGLPDIKASKHYEVSVLGGVAVIMEA